MPRNIPASNGAQMNSNSNRDDHIFISDKDIAALKISPSRLVDAIEAALVAKAKGRIHVAPKSALLPGQGRYVMSTLASDEAVTILKTVSVIPDNPDRNLPRINGAILLLDAKTGLLKAVMDANWITAQRTAALSVIAARHLAEPQSQTIGFIGCGVQAHSHLAALIGFFPVRHVLVCSRTRAAEEEFCAKARQLGISARATDAEETLRAADIVVTSITLDYSVTPFLNARWMKPTAFATITDLCIPWKPDSLHIFKTLVVDDLEQERTAERPLLRHQTIAGDLVGLVTGQVDQGRRPAAFAFRGIALGDFATANLVYQLACKGKGESCG